MFTILGLVASTMPCRAYVQAVGSCRATRWRAAVPLFRPLPAGHIVAPTSHFRIFQIDQARSGLSGFYIVAMGSVLAASLPEPQHFAGVAVLVCDRYFSLIFNCCIDQMCSV